MNNVNLIREHTKAVKDNKFDRWFSENMKKIKEREFARIDENTMQAQTKKEIIRAIDKWLDESAI